MNTGIAGIHSIANPARPKNGRAGLEGLATAKNFGRAPGGPMDGRVPVGVALANSLWYNAGGKAGMGPYGSDEAMVDSDLWPTWGP